jgi:hypothetical protein
MQRSIMRIRRSVVFAGFSGNVLLATGCGNNQSAHAAAQSPTAAVPAAADLSPDALASRMLERRVIEAVIWGMPANS